jgi:hypothetical protein
VLIDSVSVAARDKRVQGQVVSRSVTKLLLDFHLGKGSGVGNEGKCSVICHTDLLARISCENGAVSQIARRTKSMTLPTHRHL